MLVGWAWMLSYLISQKPILLHFLCMLFKHVVKRYFWATPDFTATDHSLSLDFDLTWLGMVGASHVTAHSLSVEQLLEPNLRGISRRREHLTANFTRNLRLCKMCLLITSFGAYGTKNSLQFPEARENNPLFSGTIFMIIAIDLGFKMRCFF